MITLILVWLLCSAVLLPVFLAALVLSRERRESEAARLRRLEAERSLDVLERPGERMAGRHPALTTVH